MNVKKAEELLRIWQTWLGPRREACDEVGKEVWDEIEATLSTTPARPKTDAAVAAIEFAITDDGGCEAVTFLNLWLHGEFDRIRLNWDNVPEEVFIGADPLYVPDTLCEGEFSKDRIPDEPTAWMIPRIVNFPGLGTTVAWGASIFCDSQSQPRVDRDGKKHYPYPLSRDNPELREAAKEVADRLESWATREDSIPKWPREMQLEASKMLRTALEKS